MDEKSWLTGDDPAALLRWVTGPVREDEVRAAAPLHQFPRPSGRKLRLFAVAVTRAAFNDRTGRIVREDVDTAERHADGLASADELTQARIASHLFCCERYEVVAARAAVHFGETVHPGLAAHFRPIVAGLLRDVVGNPFRAASPAGPCKECDGEGLVYQDIRPNREGPEPDIMYVTEPPTHVQVKCRPCGGSGVAGPPWLTPAVRAVAEEIYQARAFDRLPFLADAMEESGCADPMILAHCRGSCQACDRSHWHPSICQHCHGERATTTHTRGCWAVDLATGRA